jgi:hypothetical protein
MGKRPHAYPVAYTRHASLDITVRKTGRKGAGKGQESKQRNKVMITQRRKDGCSGCNEGGGGGVGRGVRKAMAGQRDAIRDEPLGHRHAD